MKKYFPGILLLVIQLSTSLPAQDIRPPVSGFPVKSNSTVIYGTDVLIQPVPTENQMQCKISAAFNGWIYVAYIIQGNGFRVARSTDNGQTWTYSTTLRASHTLTSLDIIATGNTTSSLRIWIVNSGYFTAAAGTWDVDLEELNGDLTSASSHTIESMISNFGYWGVAIASDYNFPSAGTSPFSLAVLYSKGGETSDNIIFKSSSTGNSVFDNTQVITNTGICYSWVALSYGRSPAYPDGRYFAVWKKQFNHVGWYADYQGEIYTSFTTGQYNGPWSAPLRVDSFTPAGAGRSNHPTIASQVNDWNNLISGLTTVILFDSPDAGEVMGVFNLNPMTSNDWTPMTIDEFSMQPDITFDNIQGGFFITWCDSLNQQLKVGVQDLNITYPANWTIIATGYNDTANLKAPFPRVRVNAATWRLVNVWTGERSSGIGNATYDGANLSTGIPENESFKSISMVISPNPALDFINVNIISKTSGMGILKIFDVSGREVLLMQGMEINPGQNSKKIKIKNLPPGIYQVIFKTDRGIASARLVIIK